MQQNAVGWFDIYVSDMDRAQAFYEAVFGGKLEQISDPTDDTVIMKAFTADMAIYGAGGALVKKEGAQPSSEGVTLYFGVEDCAITEKLIEPNGGKLIAPKFSIGKFGFVTLFLDSEGNKVGLSSMK